MSEHLPTHERPHFVYRIYGPGDRLLYIGCTREVEHRIYMHERCAWSNAASNLIWAHGGIARWTSEEHPNKASGHAAERAAIKAEAPVCNQQGNPKRWRKVAGGYEPVVPLELPPRTEPTIDLDHLLRRRSA